MTFDIQNNNCLHAVNEKLAEHGVGSLPEFVGDPSNPLVRHRYCIKLFSILSELNDLYGIGVVLMTRKNLFHHIGFYKNGLIFSAEENSAQWLTENELLESGYRRFIYLECK